MGVNANGTKETRKNHPPSITGKGKTMNRMSAQALGMKQKYHTLREGATEGRGHGCSPEDRVQTDEASLACECVLRPLTCPHCSSADV